MRLKTLFMLQVVQFMEQANLPFSENSVDNPISFYAATKKANESMAHSIATYIKYQLLV